MMLSWSQGSYLYDICEHYLVAYTDRDFIADSQWPSTTVSFLFHLRCPNIINLVTGGCNTPNKYLKALRSDAWPFILYYCRSVTYIFSRTTK